jgi:hypothetical protein
LDALNATGAGRMACSSPAGMRGFFVVWGVMLNDSQKMTMPEMTRRSRNPLRQFFI